MEWAWLWRFNALRNWALLLSCDYVLKFDWYCQLSGSGSNSLNSWKLPGHFSYGLGMRLPRLGDLVNLCYMGKSFRVDGLCYVCCWSKYKGCSSRIPIRWHLWNTRHLQRESSLIQIRPPAGWSTVACSHKCICRISVSVHAHTVKVMGTTPSVKIGKHTRVTGRFVPRPSHPSVCFWWPSVCHRESGSWMAKLTWDIPEMLTTGHLNKPNLPT